MRYLARAWWTLIVVATFLGAFLAVAAVPVGVWAGAAVLGGGTVGLAAGTLRDRVPPHLPSRAACAAAAGCVAGCGLLVFLPLTASLYLLALAGSGAVLGVRAWARTGVATAWQVRVVPTGRPATRASRPSRPSRDPRACADVHDALRLVLRRWSDAQLCEAWRLTAVIGREEGARGDVRASMETAARRDLLLDELERRHPAGMAAWLDAWLAAGPSVPADPGPFLRAPGRAA